MRKLTLLTFILLLALPLIVTAQGDPAENACYEGGSMWRDNGDGCPTQWHWMVGWYLAYWESNGGWSNPDNFFPSWADPGNVLPPLPEPPEVVSSGPDFPSAGCLPLGGAYYINFGGGWWVPAGSNYFDSTCSAVMGQNKLDAVYAPAPYNPDSLCKQAFGASFTMDFNIFGDTYACND